MGIDFRKPTPLYCQIVEDIRMQIVDGRLKEGDQLGSHQQLALSYGVSLITIKKALADLITAGVLFSRVGKGTFIAPLPTAAAPVHQKLIGLVLRDLKDPYFSLILHGVEAHTSEKGYSLLLANSSDLLEKEESQIQHLRSLGADGLIIASSSHIYTATPTIRKLHAQNFPYVMVSYIEDEDISYVGSDNELGGFMATEHLLKLGYASIGFIAGESGNLLSDLRKKGYHRALAQYGQVYREEFTYRLQSKWNDFQEGYEIGRTLLDSPVRPRAIFAYKDLVALGLKQALLDQGLKVPDDLAIVGFDDIERAQYAPVPLTTIHQATDQIGALAVEALLARIEGVEHVPTRQILKPSLIVRASCGADRRGVQNGS